MLPELKCAEADHQLVESEDGQSTIKMNLPPIEDDQFPTVSIVIPTYNRQKFWPLIIRNWKSIDYPREKLELVILDDSPSIGNTDIFKDDPQIKYYHVKEKLTIGAKRNLLCSKATHEYIVHMDDDDWYPRESVAARIRILLEYEKSLENGTEYEKSLKNGTEYEKSLGTDGCFGCSKVLCLDLLSNQMFEAYDESETLCVPATLSESTMAYSKRYWNAQKWDPKSNFTECLPFIQGRHQTVCTGPSIFVVTQFSHTSNTVQRRVNKSPVSEQNAQRFHGSLTMYDSGIFNKLRAEIVKGVPDYKQAIAFIQKNQHLPIKKFKKMIKRTKESILTNPLVMKVIREKISDKTTTTGKDLVYYCGPGSYLQFSNKWNPLSKQLGGSEEAVINLSNELAGYGWNVTVYCCLNGEPKTYLGPNKEEVKYKNYWEWLPDNFQDVTIIWRDPSNCIYPINASKKVFLDLHDALDPCWLNGLNPKVNIMTKSNYHREIIKNPTANVIPNGIHPIRTGNRVKNLMICTSTPDRCLGALLRAMPIIRAEIPDAEIHWAYGFKAGLSKGGLEADEHPEVKKWVTEVKDLIRNTPGFVDLGRLSQKNINKLYSKADLFVYATRFPEIDCISLTKAMSAGAIPIVTPSGAMAEKMGINDQISHSTRTDKQIDTSLENSEYFNQYVSEIIKTLKISDNMDPTRLQITKTANSLYNWEYIGSKWNKLLTMD
jgi:glycosyltransferase involved in cell wall biosynthesis